MSANVVTRLNICPQCGGYLSPVTQRENSFLNRDQFDSMKAGDYYCGHCPSNDRGQQPLCYWWEHELPAVHDYQI